MVLDQLVIWCRVVSEDVWATKHNFVNWFFSWKQQIRFSPRLCQSQNFVYGNLLWWNLPANWVKLILCVYMWAIILFCLVMAGVNYWAKFYFGGIRWDFRFNERGTMPSREQKAMVFLFIWAFILIKTQTKEYQIEIFQALETIMESCPRHSSSFSKTQIYCFDFPYEASNHTARHLSPMTSIHLVLVSITEPQNSSNYALCSWCINA